VITDCLMGQDPPAGGGAERFYVLVMQELAIYGHTVDAWTAAHYPEDVPQIEAARANGREFGCWHSAWCPDGEIGSQDARELVQVDYGDFVAAKRHHWPDLAKAGVPVTREGAAIVYLAPDPEGELHHPIVGRVRQVWSSLDEDTA
jgi:hypothetical protein